MECELIRLIFQEQLQLRADLIYDARTAEVVVTLNDGFVLHITPNAIAYGGYSSWFRPALVKNQESGLPKSVTELQVTASIKQVSENSSELLVSFAERALSVEQLLRRVLAKVEKYCNTRLVPLPIVHNGTN